MALLFFEELKLNFGEAIVSSKGSLPLIPTEDSEALDALNDEGCPVVEVGRCPRLSRVVEKVLLEAVRTLESKSPNIFISAVGVEPSSMLKFRTSIFASRISMF